MKKVLFTIFLVFIILFYSNVYAKTEFSASSTSGRLNDDVEVKINMSDSQKFMALGIKLRYDKDILEFKNCKINEFKNAYMKGCKKGKKGITFYAISSNDDLINKNNNIFNVYFKIKKEFTNTSINLDVTDYSKSLDDDLDYDTKSGVITFINDDNNSKEVNSDAKESNSKLLNNKDSDVKSNINDNKDAISTNKKVKNNQEIVKSNLNKNILFVIILVIVFLIFFIIFQKKYSKMK